MWKGLTWGWVWGVWGGGGVRGDGVNIFFSSAVPCDSELSNADFSVCTLGTGGGGVNLRKALVTFVLFFGMELLWDDINHISKDRIC